MSNMKQVIFVSLSIFMLSASGALAAEDVLTLDPKILVIQAVIFIAAIFILHSLLFKPLLGLVEKRDELTTGKKMEAEELREKAENLIEEYKQKIQQAREQAMEERNKIRREAQQAADKMITEAREESQARLDEAKARLGRETEDIKAKIKPDIEALAREMASRILDKEVRA